MVRDMVRDMFRLPRGAFAPALAAAVGRRPATLVARRPLTRACGGASVCAPCGVCRVTRYALFNAPPPLDYTPLKERRACASDRAQGRAFTSRWACPLTELTRRTGEDDDIGRSEGEGRSARRAAPPSAEARVELLSFLRCRSTLSCENVCSWGCGVFGRRTASGMVAFSAGDGGVLRGRGTYRDASAGPVVRGPCRQRGCCCCCCCCAGALHSAISTSERRAGMPTFLSSCSAEAGWSTSTIAASSRSGTNNDQSGEQRGNDGAVQGAVVATTLEGEVSGNCSTCLGRAAAAVVVFIFSSILKSFLNLQRAA